MKKLIYSVFPAIIFIYIFGMISCSDMDDYLKYTDGKPRQYTGRVDSVKFMSGDERIVFYGLLTSDPKIIKVKIYWNTRGDSIVMDINRSTGTDTLYVPIPLPEGRYNFEVYTYDKDGNPSIPVNAAGVSYGEDYKQSIYNRVIKKAEKVGNDVIIDWYNGDESSPFVRIDYTDSDDTEHVVKVVTSEKQTTLENFKSMSKFRLQTYFLPDKNAIDTFKVSPEFIGVPEDITNIYIRNAGNPFIRGGFGTGKWDIPKDWLYTPNVINQEGNTLGCWSTDAGGVLHFESKDWGGEGWTNGKVYQTMSLPAGIYSVEFYSDGGGSNNFKGIFVAAEGTSLPDIENKEQSLALYEWDHNNMSGTRSIRFVLDEPKTISVGWVATFGSNTWMHINYIKLMSLAE